MPLPRPDSKPDKLLVATCVLGAVVTWRFSDFLGPSEFSGGSVTRPLFRLPELAGGIFPLAIIAAFFNRRLAAGVTFLASVLAAPLDFYVLAPGVFQRNIARAIALRIAAHQTLVLDRQIADANAGRREIALVTAAASG